MHQLAREVWPLEAPPIVGAIGYAFEPVLMSIYRRAPIATISESSARTFQDFGLRGPITVAGIALQPPAKVFGTPRIGRIGYVGRIAPSKRIDHIIRAIALLRERGLPAELVVVGAGLSQERDRLQRIAHALRAAQFVQFTGRISMEERDRTMRSLDLLAMTSVREGWGLVVSEAARFGVPSVVYPVPGLVDAVRDGETGIVCARESPQSLASGCAALSEDRTLRNRFGAAAARNLFAYDDERSGTFEPLRFVP